MRGNLTGGYITWVFLLLVRLWVTYRHHRYIYFYEMYRLKIKDLEIMTKSYPIFDIK